MKTWQGRIASTADPLFEAFTSSVGQDRRLASYDIQVSRAHALALARAGVITQTEGDSLVCALAEIAEELHAGQFAWSDELEDVHTHIESRLREKIGTVADALHAGRSRNDQIAADLRLYVRDRTMECLAALLDLQDALLELSDRYQCAVMPGYTHLQQAQPLLVAQPLLAYVSMLARDWERFQDGLERINSSPLGAGALAGSSFSLDRDFLAGQCGFETVATNSLDAVSDRDFLVEFVGAAALCMTHLSRFSEDLILWASSEFGFVRLPDAFSSGSSMMPQKKNPDVAELIRGKTALVIGDSTALLALVKGLPLGYNRDLQEDKTPLYHAADTLVASLRILSAMVPHIEFDTNRMERAISSFSLATDLADHLVKQGIPFRQAHGMVARIVSDSLEQDRELGGVEWDEVTDMPELTARASVARKITAGSTGPDAVRRQIADARDLVGSRRHRLGAQA